MQITNNELEQPNIDTEIPNEIQATPFPKNSWLYPTDTVGKLEKGVVIESKTYCYENEVNKDKSYTVYTKHTF